jgi:hypothetical protein
MASTNMKKLLFLLTAFCLLAPSVSYATTTVALISTSTPPNGFITPNQINGVNQALIINGAATSSINKLKVGSLEAPIFSSGACTGNAFIVDSPTFVVDCTNNRVGIGVTSPLAKLVVKGSTSDSSANALDVVSSSDSSKFSVRNDGVIQTTNFALEESGASIRARNSLPITFQTNVTERMRIDLAGNIGIGSTTPSQALSVQGGAYISSSLFVGGTVTSTTTATSTLPNLQTTNAIKSGNYYSSDGTVGFTGTCTIVGLVSITVKNGLITACQ